MRSGSERRETGGEDLVRSRVGEERDDGDIAEIPVVAEIEIRVQRIGDGNADGLEFVKQTNNRGVTQSFARIFAGGDAGLKVFLGDCEPEIQVGRGRQRCCRVEANFKRTRARVRRRKRREEQARFGTRRGPANLITSFRRITADELRAAVDDHLWSIDAAFGEDCGVVLLAAGEGGGGERIAPAKVVPIVDVLFEGKDLSAVDGLLVG